jgi:hypothetical protein
MAEGVRGHYPVTLDEFNGLFKRDDNDEACPPDHFRDCLNLQSQDKTFKTRDGIDTMAGPGEVIRAYKFKSETYGEGLIVLNSAGEFFHQTYGPDATLGPILTVPTATDFVMLDFAGKAYISPITGLHGTSGEFLYVYLGAGVNARKAAGTGVPSSAIVAANGAAGFTDAGLHIFAVVGETDTGYLSPPTGMVAFTTDAAFSVSFSSVPVFTGSQWTKRHIVASKVTLNWNGDLTGQQFYFIPNATINDNSTTTLADISFYDIELLDDASHLIDNFSEIPAGAVLSTYNGRLLIGNGDFGEGVAYLSEPGEYEAIDQVDGFIIPPERTVHLTNAVEYRDVLYVFKKDRTYSYIDNGDVPSAWEEPTTIDNGIGTGFHGIATVLDSKGINIEFVVISHSSGLYGFSGTYVKPELSWKIEKHWLTLDGSDNHTQLLIDSINKKILILLQNGRMLMVDFSDNMDYKEVKWWPWSFDAFISTIVLLEGPTLILGSSGNI